jgi:hypothetical protein
MGSQPPGAWARTGLRERCLMRADFGHLHKENPRQRRHARPGMEHFAVGLTDMPYPVSAVTASKSSEIVITSTGTCPAAWRAWWRLHGVTWPALTRLHLEICDAIRANSSLWGCS